MQRIEQKKNRTKGTPYNARDSVEDSKYFQRVKHTIECKQHPLSRLTQSWLIKTKF